jgi:hypothetical protein
MRTFISACLLVAAAVAPAWGQADPATGARPGNVIGTGQSLPLSDKASNATSGDTASVIAPRLPTPGVGDDASPVAFLQSAQRAMALGRTGEAQEALERAEARLLDRSVAPSRAGIPDEQPLVTMVGNARRALGEGDTAAADRLITDALKRLQAS